MGQDDNIRNPVEEYLQYIMDQGKREKPAETTPEPARHLEVRESGFSDKANVESSSGQDALKIADAIKQSVNIRREPRPEESEEAKSEERVFDIKPQPVGLILIISAIIGAYGVTFSFISFLVPGLANLLDMGIRSVGAIAGVLMLIAFAAGLIFLAIKARGFMLDRLVLTNFHITQVLNTGLFTSKATDLPLYEIEDVIIQKNGLFPMLFNYGTLIVQTPEGVEDIVFKYAPDPDNYAKSIHDVRLGHLANYTTG